MKIKAYVLGVLATCCLWLIPPNFAYPVQVMGNASYPLQQDLYNAAPNLFTGTFQYSIPIETPPGRNGIQPNLALTYNSAGGSTWIGSGWDLNLGDIERSSQYGVSYSGNTGTIVLRLNGVNVTLVKVSTDSNGNTEWREKYQTSFYRILGMAASGTPCNTYWEVIDKHGTRYFFGASTSSTDCQRNATLGTFSWKLDRVEDTDGNTMTVTYSNPNSDPGQVYPQSIAYTSNPGSSNYYAPYIVNFFLEKWGCSTNNPGCTVIGVPTTYVPGFQVVTGSRLKTITVDGVGSTGTQTLIRAYSLNYTHNSTTNLDQLSTVQEYGDNVTVNSTTGVITGTPLIPPVTLTYNAAAVPSPSPYQLKLEDSAITGPPTAVGDFNGQGYGGAIFPYYAIIQGTGYNGWLVCPYNSVQRIPVCPAVTSPSQGNWFPYYSFTAAAPSYAADYNGDGITDFLWNSTANQNTVTWNLCEGVLNGTINQNACMGTTGLPTNEVPTAVADFDGDGLPDLLFVTSSNTIKVCINQNVGRLTNGAPLTLNFSCQPAINSSVLSACATNSAYCAIRDFDGDGKADIFYKPSAAAAQVCYSTINASGIWGLTCVGFPASGVGSAFNSAPVSGEIRNSGDFNGDGLADVSRYYINTTNNTYQVDICLSQGMSHTFDCYTNQLTGYFPSTTTTALWGPAGDVNGDGRTDFIGQPSSGSPWYYCLSNGGEGNNAAFSCTSFTVNGIGANTPTFGDFNGTGVTDAVGSYSINNSNCGDSSTECSDIYALNFDSLYSGLLRQINNGIGGTVEINYESLSQLGTYGSTCDAISPLTVTGNTLYLSNTGQTLVCANDAAGITVPSSNLPFHVHVVSSINTSCNDLEPFIQGCNGTTESYYYYGGLYDLATREFRGFDAVTDVTPLGPSNEQTYETSLFIQGQPGTGNSIATDGYLTGQLSEKLVVDSGNSGSTHQTNTNYSYCLPQSSNCATYSATNTYDCVNGSCSATSAPYFTPVASVVTDKFSYTSAPSTPTISTETDYAYTDTFGNLTTLTEQGDTSIASDNRQTVYTYTTGAYDPTSDLYMVGLPASKILYDQSITPNVENAVTNYYYGDLGSCVESPSTVTNQNPSLGYHLQRISRLNLQASTTADFLIGSNSGNVACTTDAKGNITTYTYDSNNTFLLTTSYPLISEVTTNQYYGVNNTTAGNGYNGYFGQLMSVTDLNGGIDTKTYDAMGRLSQEYSPLSATTPFVTYVYPALTSSTSQFGEVCCDYVGDNSQNIQQTYTGNYSNSNANQQYEIYFDGFGRTIRVAQVPNNLSGATADIVTDTIYDTRHQIFEQSLPFFSSSNNENLTKNNHDGFENIYEIDYPDTTKSLACTDGKNSATVAAFAQGGTGQEKRYVQDGLGRPIQINEYNTAVSTCSTTLGSPYATTNYLYDPANHLTKVTDAATPSNVTTLVYDSLGRKTSMTDPDMGSWSYVYDNNNNLTEQTDAKSQSIYFQYDELNRLLQKDYGSQKTLGSGDNDYTYDNNYSGLSAYSPPMPPTTYSVGRLAWVKDTGGIRVHYYDYLGNEIQSDQQVSSAGTTWYDVKTSYDALNRATAITYPDATSVPYTYDSYGNLWTVGSYATFTPGSGATNGYNASGQYGQLSYGNGLITTQTYNGANLNLVSVQTGTPSTPTWLQNISYNYNTTTPTCGANASELCSITGTVYDVQASLPISVNETFGYDALNRLTSADTAWNGNYTYNYSVIGNITSGPFGSYANSSTQPHTVTSLTGNSNVTYSYDANGNMTGRGPTTLAYDYENRLISASNVNATTTFLYDTNGHRVLKNVGGTQTVYIGDLYECTSGVCTKYIFAKDRRIASVSGSQTYYYHLDHLGSTNVVTDITGHFPQETVLYRPFGYSDLQDGSIDMEHLYTGQTQDVSTGLYYYGARYYDVTLGRFIQADTQISDYTNPQTLNRYSYVNNDPLSYADPTGHAPWYSGISSLYNMGLGSAVHAQSFSLLVAQQENPEDWTLNTTVGGLFGNSRPDATYSNGDTNLIFELKPLTYSYASNPYLYAQVVSYMNNNVANANASSNLIWQPGSTSQLLGAESVPGEPVQYFGSTFSITYYADTYNDNSGIIFYTATEINDSVQTAFNRTIQGLLNFASGLMSLASGPNDSTSSSSWQPAQNNVTNWAGDSSGGLVDPDSGAIDNFDNNSSGTPPQSFPINNLLP